MKHTHIINHTEPSMSSLFQIIMIQSLRSKLYWQEGRRVLFAFVCFKISGLQNPSWHLLSNNLSIKHKFDLLVRLVRIGKVPVFSGRCFSVSCLQSNEGPQVFDVMNFVQRTHSD